MRGPVTIPSSTARLRPNPRHLGTDVALSLGTRNYSEAEHFAAALGLSFVTPCSPPKVPTTFDPFSASTSKTSLPKTCARFAISVGLQCTA